MNSHKSKCFVCGEPGICHITTKAAEVELAKVEIMNPGALVNDGGKHYCQDCRRV